MLPTKYSFTNPIAQLAGAVEYTVHLYRGVRPPPSNECPDNDTKQSDGEAPVILGFWGMQSTPSLPWLPGPLWPGVVVPDKGPIYGLNRAKLHTYAKLNCLI